MAKLINGFVKTWIHVPIMPRTENRLTAAQVKKTRKPGFYPDGRGLFLQVTTGVDGEPRKSWVLRYLSPTRTRVEFPNENRVREMGLGSAGVLELAQVRIKAEQARRLVAEGIDPIDHRKVERVRRVTEAAKTVTFKEAAERFLEAHEGSWKNAKHRQQWRNTLATYVYKVFGDEPVDAIDRKLVLRVIEPIWSVHTETASRIRSRIERILNWARARGLRNGENPASWRGQLEHALPARRQVQKVEHHPALPYAEIPAFMTRVRKRRGMAAHALEFTILTAARTTETVGAIWKEIDLNKKIWTVPAERMKASREHRVPLSPGAIAVLDKVKLDRSGDDWVFPGLKAKASLSTMAMLMTLRKMGRADITVHGFRSTFKDWAAEQTDFAREVSEAALAHAIGDKVEAAYRRGDLFDKRRALMEAWSSYCATPGREQSPDEEILTIAAE